MAQQATAEKKKRQISIAPGGARARACVNQTAPRDSDPCDVAGPGRTAAPVQLWPQGTVFNPCCWNVWAARSNSACFLTPLRWTGGALKKVAPFFIDQQTCVFYIKAPSSCCWLFQLLRHLLHGSPRLSDLLKLCEVISRQTKQTLQRLRSSY